ncbi:Fc receptor-like protein 4-like protein [Turdus rufiventris]|nr:Fc receptor-like protein 4-like protein [Turdus rufiventris]
MAGKVALLLWGAQTTQLLVEPPWTPAVLWDQVTLTCQGSGTAGATTWHKDGRRWWQEGPDSFTVTRSGNYESQRPGSGISTPVMVSNEPLVLQVPARVQLEWDVVTLRCQGWQDNPVTGHNNSSRFRCEGLMDSKKAQSALETVTVHGVPPSGVSLSVQPPEGQVALGNSLELSCAVAMGTGPLSFSWHQNRSAEPPGTGPRLEVQHVEVNDSGHYQCRVSNGDSVAESPTLNVTVMEEWNPWAGVPVANATITPGPPALQVHPGDLVTLRCSVQVGSAPVTFTWLHNGREVARGPLLELGDIKVGHLGTYQCMATNQLGQDGHRMFWALSPELELEVTPQGTTGHLWNTGDHEELMGTYGQQQDHTDIYQNVL